MCAVTNSMSPNTKIESAKINENFTDVTSGDGMETNAFFAFAQDTSVNLTGSLIDATEDVAGVVTLTIPENWANYNVLLMASYRIDDNANLALSNLSFRFRRGNGVGGTQIALWSHEISNTPPDNQTVSYQYLDTSQTSTGSVSYSFTAKDDTNDDYFQVAQMSFTAIAFRQ